LLGNGSYLLSFQPLRWLVDYVLCFPKATTIELGRGNDCSWSLIQPTVIFLHFLLIKSGKTVQNTAEMIGLLRFGRIEVGKEVDFALLTLHAFTVDVRSRSNGLKMSAVGGFKLFTFLKGRKELL
jgi:hypothetical protein